MVVFLLTGESRGSKAQGRKRRYGKERWETLKTEFYLQLVGIGLQNSSFEVQCSSLGSCNPYQVSRGSVREWRRPLFPGRGDRLSLPEESHAPRPPACPGCSGGRGQTTFNESSVYCAWKQAFCHGKFSHCTHRYRVHITQYGTSY